jgi:mannitol-1-phosphate 5-dehydrogenase
VGKALVIGAGAIGRGFLPWALRGMNIDFYDSSPKMVNDIASNGGFHSHMTIDGKLESLWVEPDLITNDFSKLNLEDYVIAFISVGPRNVSRMPERLGELKCPIFSLENDPTSVEVIRNIYGLEKVFFGVPDVITSSTASPENLALDPMAIHTEDGILYLEDFGAEADVLRSELPDVNWSPADQLRREWSAKLYLHNTPHCVAAYLGHMAGFSYVHEGFTKSRIERVVSGVVEEMLLTLKLKTSYDHAFLESYAEKELQRFSNQQLYDPIARVAREPLRKLAPTGRLTGALRLAMSAGVEPVNLMLGISAALRYDNENDPDTKFLKYLDDFGVSAFLQYHLSMDTNSLESQYIVEKNTPATQFLKGLTQ